MQQPGSWHRSGKFLVFEELQPVTKSDLMILPMDGDETSGWQPGTPYAFADTPFAERQPTFSPDGRWLAYVSDEAGRDEVYVRPFRGPGKWPISTEGGNTPTWSRTQSALFYGIGPASATGRIIIVPFAVEGDSFLAEKPRLWSEGRYQTRGPSRMFDLHPDGTRFAIAPIDPVQSDGEAAASHVYPQLLRRAAATCTAVTLATGYCILPGGEVGGLRAGVGGVCGEAPRLWRGQRLTGPGEPNMPTTSSGWHSEE